MTKKQLIKLLKKAKTDQFGNLYVERNDIESIEPNVTELGKVRNYFCLVETVCYDFTKEYVDNIHEEYYDKHFTKNDDRLTITMIKKD